jgi:hypothetical protein
MNYLDLGRTGDILYPSLNPPTYSYDYDEQRTLKDTHEIETHVTSEDEDIPAPNRGRQSLFDRRKEGLIG